MMEREGPQTDEAYEAMIAGLRKLDTARTDIYALTHERFSTTPDGQVLRSRPWVRYIDPQRLDPSED